MWTQSRGSCHSQSTAQKDSGIEVKFLGYTYQDRIVSPVFQHMYAHVCTCMFLYKCASTDEGAREHKQALWLQEQSSQKGARRHSFSQGQDLRVPQLLVVTCEQ